MIKYILNILITIACIQSVQAYNITGRIIDSQSQKPLHGAIFLAKNENKKVVIGIQADQTGRFTSGNVSDSILSVIVYHTESYDTLKMTLRGIPDGLIDIGNLPLKRAYLQLNEVTVTASGRPIQTPDRYIVYPSQRELSQNASTINLLEHLQFSMPGLKVIESLNQVSINGLVPEYLINGRKVPLSRILALNNSNIQRIEYYDTPQMKFGDRPAINFILKPRSDGGSFFSNISSAITTKNIGGNIGLTIYKSKSEWNLNYNISHRNYNDRRVNQEEHFISEQNIDFTRLSKGYPGKFAYTNNNLALGYTFKPGEKTLLSFDISGNLYSQNLNDIACFTQNYNGTEALSSTSTKRSAKLKSPTIDMYLQQKYRNNQTFELNMFGVYYNGNFTRDYDNSLNYTSINTTTSNRSWRIGGEMKYSIRFSKHTAYLGISDNYNRALTDLTENGIPEKSNMGINNIFIYGQLTGRLSDKLTYNTNIGLKSFLTSNRTENNNATRAKAALNLAYFITNPFSLSYMFLYDPSLPGTGIQSNIIQTVNDFILQTGNINIKPLMLLKNQIKAQYSKGNIISTLTTGYSRTYNPIFYNYTYISNPSNQYYNKFIGRPENGKYNSALCIEGEFAYRNLFNYLNIGVNGGWCDYLLKREGWSDSYSFGFGSIFAAFSIADFKLTTQYTLAPFYNLSGNTFSRPERWNTITAQYKFQNWYFSVTAVNLFTKRGSLYHSWANTPTYINEDWVNILNCKNMVLLNMAYRFNFGKSMNKNNRTIKNGGIDSGVNINL